MEKYVWKGYVAEGKMEEYIRRHNEIWPEMTETLNAAGIYNYTIWNHGNELFGYYECESVEYALKVQAESPVVQKWNEYMDDILTIAQDPVSGEPLQYRKVFSHR